MKLTALFLILGLLQVSARSGAQITLREKAAPLEKVLKAIKKQSGYDLVFNENLVKAKGKPVAVNVDNVPVEVALKEVFRYQDELTYSIDGKIIGVREITKKPLLTEGLNLRLESPPPPTVRGRITNEKGEAVAGVSIAIKGGKIISVTNDNGEFTLSNIPDNATLVFSAITIETFETKLNGRTELALSAKIKVSELEEIVINKGYYTEKQKLSTGNISIVREKDIEKQPVGNVLLALEGRVPGLVVAQANGLPGGAVNVQIRGRNTISQGTAPLYIVNGVPVTTQTYATSSIGGLGALILGTGSGSSGISPLSMIDPSDIESIEILKDADATAIYGSRAANGVVLINTKKGKVTGGTKVTVNVQYGSGKVTRRADLMNTQQYLQMRKEAFSNDNKVPTVANAPDLLVWDSTSYTDWQKVMIGGTAGYLNAQTSVSGGNEFIQYVIGGGYRKESTVLPGDWNDKKGSLHFNITSKSLNNKFRLELSGMYVADNNFLPQNDFTNYITIAPNAPWLYKADGTLNWTNYTDNPFRQKAPRYIANTSNLVASAVISYELLRRLSVKANIGYTQMQIFERTAVPPAYYNPANNITTGSANFNNNSMKSLVVEPQIHYELVKGRNRINALVGTTFQSRETEGQTINGSGYSDNDVLLGSLAAATTISRGNSVYERYKYNSVFSRVGYSYDDKYMLNLTARRDGSSRFGPGKRFGNFGAIGLGWIASKETFFKNISFISFAKLRASYGTSGNEPANNYAFMELYNYRTDNPYGGGAGLYPNNLTVPEFSWEVNKKFEVGIELGLFKDKLNLTAVYYRNISSNQLVSQPLTTLTGFSSVVANLPATVLNRSLEFTLSSTNIKTGKFTWTTNLNATLPTNRLLSFENIATNSQRQFYSVGQPLSSKKVYGYAGVDPTTGNYQFYDAKGVVTFSPASTDKIYHADLTPKIYGGIFNSFTYKNLQLDIDLQFVKQNGFNYLYRNYPPGYTSGGQLVWNQPVEWMNRWKQAGDITSYQKFSTNYPNSWDYITSSDAAYSDASFIRLKNLSLAYVFNNGFIKKAGLQQARVYIQAQNLLTITKYKGADPETQTITSLPPLRVITVGLQVNL